MGRSQARVPSVVRCTVHGFVRCVEGVAVDTGASGHAKGPNEHWSASGRRKERRREGCGVEWSDGDVEKERVSSDFDTIDAP